MKMNRKISPQGSSIHKTKKKRPAFLLVLVLIVIAMASLAALNFSQSMLISHETARISGGRLQARMCAESGAQSIRLFLSYPRLERTTMGGTWSNPTKFQSLNVIPDIDPARRGNFSVMAPSLDEFGNYGGIRYGLQNESAKLNLNTLAQLDSLASSGDMAASAVSGATGGATAGGATAGGAAAGGAAGGASAMAGITSALASEVTASVGSSLAINILLALPGMTEEVAYAILDFIDEDDEPREDLGAEFSDYYSQLQPAYKPANGPLQSIEQLLLVRGVTPAMLYGYDENRNGILDQAEMNKKSQGIQPGLPPGSVATTNTDPSILPPPDLGWAPYLTLHSLEKNVASDGAPRININSDDLQTLYDDLVATLGNETWASFIVAYRLGGTPGGDGTSPMVKLATMAAATEDEDVGGAMGVQLGAIQAATQQGGQTGGQQSTPWTADALAAFDLTQQGSVTFNQVLDLVDATVAAGGGQGGQAGGQGGTFSSPFGSGPLEIANWSPLLMDYLTTVDAPAVPGRINIMECPQEILRGVPGLSDDIVDQILEARVDGSESETRDFETWLVIEGYLTLDEMRGLMPLLTCGGDVFKAQVVGYLEGNAASSRVEIIVNAAGDLPQIQFFRKMDHLGRGFDIATLGQRFDAGTMSGTMLR